ncbi:MAG: CarD family transcriptional regulator [Nitrospinae bacterium]|nr:CarD family transcriptional regulator [Nitrospinota bacterium]
MEQKELTSLKRGARVVYPAHGVGIVEKVERIKTNETASTTPFYTIRIDESGMTIRVPAARALQIGIRSVIKEVEVRKVLRLLRTKDKVANGMNWHKRQKSYIDRIKSGSVFELAEILRELTLIQTKKELSFGEQRMYDNVRQLMVMEIAEAKGIEKSQASKLLDKAFDS